MTDRHAERVSRAKLVLIVMCLIAIPVTFWWNHQDVGSVNNRVTRIESPCQRYGSESKICQEAFETAVHSINHRIACYIDHKAGKPYKPSCVGVRLRIEAKPRGHADTKGGPLTPAPEGGDASEAHPGHSPAVPHGGGGTGGSGNGGGHHKGGGGAPGPGGSGGDEGTGSPTSSTSESSTSSSTTERTETTLEETKPEEVGAPGLGALGEGVGKTAEGVGTTVQETGHAVDETVKGITCVVGIGDCSG